MTVEPNAAFGPARPRLYFAGAALAALLLASPAFAGCGSSGVSAGAHPASVHTGVSSGVHSASASTGAGGGSSACATGISNATKTASSIHVAGGSVSGGAHAHLAHQSFKFHSKPNNISMGPHRRNP
jgi:hypothetical protein